MPTGYTYKITEGNGITFEDFILDCAKAFGACVTMRDDSNNTPIPDEFPISPYHLDALDKANKEYEEFKLLTTEDMAEKVHGYNTERRKEYEERIKKDADNRKKYKDMLKQVKQWKPPTPDHKGLKQFMIEQIETSMAYDLYEHKKPEPITVEQWKKVHLESLLYDIQYHSKGYNEEKERVVNRNKWIKELRKSLQK